MNTEINIEQFIQYTVKRFKDIEDNVDYSDLINDAMEYVEETYNVYDGQFSLLEYYHIEREVHKRLGYDMFVYDMSNKPPIECTEENSLSDIEKNRIQRDIIMENDKDGLYD